MKNLFASLLIALTLSTSSVSFAAANQTSDNGQPLPAVPAAVTFEQVEKSKLDVVIPNPINSNLNIRLSDAAGKVIATKTLSKKESGTRVRFNLTKLTDGVYYVRVGNGKSAQMKKFEIRTEVPTQTPFQEVTFI